MTQDFSRRNLVKGTAWAAPVVLASSAVPAYAASHRDLAPCLVYKPEPGEDSAYGLRTYMTTIAPNRTPREMAYEDITIPDGVSYMMFYLEGGQGGGIDNDDYSGGGGGYGAEVSGILPVKPGQRYRFFIGAGGIGYYDRPAPGGAGYPSGGGSTLSREEVVSESDQQYLFNSDFNHLVIYSGSGGGASALTEIDANENTTKLIAIAGGGGGAGARGMIGTSRANLPEDTKTALWRPFDTTIPKWVTRTSSPHLSNGGDGGEGRIPKPSTPATEVYQDYTGATIYVPSGDTAAYGTGGEGGEGEYYVDARGLSLESTRQSTIRSSSISGSKGSDDQLGSGADGAPAYAYVASIASELPNGAPSYDYNMSAFIVSAGGGGGYGGGGSGAAVAVGAQTTDQFEKGTTPNIYTVSAGAVSGAGGAGGCYVHNDVISPHIQMVGYSRGRYREEFTDGEAQYSYCPSDTNQIDYDGTMYRWR